MAFSPGSLQQSGGALCSRAVKVKLIRGLRAGCGSFVWLWVTVPRGRSSCRSLPQRRPALTALQTDGTHPKEKRPEVLRESAPATAGGWEGRLAAESQRSQGNRTRLVAFLL